MKIHRKYRLIKPLLTATLFLSVLNVSQIASAFETPRMLTHTPTVSAPTANPLKNIGDTLQFYYDGTYLVRKEQITDLINNSNSNTYYGLRLADLNAMYETVFSNGSALRGTCSTENWNMYYAGKGSYPYYAGLATALNQLDARANIIYSDVAGNTILSSSQKTNIRKHASNITEATLFIRGILTNYRATCLDNNITFADAAPAARRLNFFDRYAKGDLNKDWGADLIWRHNSGLVHFWKMNNGAKVASGNVDPTPIDSYWWAMLDVGDFDGDGDSDILWRHRYGQFHIWFMHNGYRHRSVNVTDYHLTQAWRFIDAEDLNGDGHEDLILRHIGGRVHFWLLRNGVRIFGDDVHPSSVSSHYYIADVEDLDADGDADILWRGNSGEVIYWILDHGYHQRGGLVHPNNVPSSNYDLVDVEDLDGDGDADLIWRNLQSGWVSRWILERGVLKTTGLINNHPPSFDWRIQHVTDLNSDGHGDIVWRERRGLVHQWTLQNGGLAGYGNVDNSWVTSDWRIFNPK